MNTYCLLLLVKVLLITYFFIGNRNANDRYFNILGYNIAKRPDSVDSRSELMLLNYKSDKWWKALRRRNDRNQHSYVGVWLKNNRSYYFDLVVQGRRIRKGGFRSPEHAAIARDFLIDQLGLPHQRAFCDSHYDYLINKYELIAEPGE